MSACERCPSNPGVAVEVAVDGTRLCKQCSAFLPGTTPLEGAVVIPEGYEPLGTGEVFDRAVVINHDTKHLLAHHAGAWHEVALVLSSTSTEIVVGCPTCPPPRRAKRKAGRPISELVATHRHGRAREVGPVVDRAPHHGGPSYVIFDPLGKLTPKTPTSAR